MVAVSSRTNAKRHGWICNNRRSVVVAVIISLIVIFHMIGASYYEVQYITVTELNDHQFDDENAPLSTINDENENNKETRTQGTNGLSYIERRKLEIEDERRRKSLQSRQESSQNSNRMNSELANCHLSDECIDQQAGKVSRIFPKRLGWSNPTPTSLNSEALHHGLLYVKVPKDASSTLAGVAIRISKHYNNTTVKYHHALASKARYINRDSVASFLFAPIRDPGSRALSWIYYHLSRLEKPHDEDSVLYWLQGLNMMQLGPTEVMDGRGGPQLAYSALEEIPKYSAWRPLNPTKVLHPKLVLKHVQHTMDN